MKKVIFIICFIFSLFSSIYATDKVEVRNDSLIVRESSDVRLLLEYTTVANTKNYMVFRYSRNNGYFYLLSTYIDKSMYKTDVKIIRNKKPYKMSNDIKSDLLKWINI